MLTPIRVWAMVWCCLLTWSANACDGCGGGHASLGIGSLPQNAGSYVCLYNSVQQLRLTEPPLFKSEAEEVTDFTNYNISLIGAWQMHPKWSLIVDVPYKITRAFTDGATDQYHGFGDASVYAVYQLKKTSQQSFNLRLGCKTPTGRFEANAEEGLPASFQLGTGSWDAMLGLNYNRQWQWWHFNADVQYTMSTANRVAYKYGNQAAAQGLARYQVVRSPLTGTVMLGARAQYGWSDYADYQKKYLLKSTGGWMASAIAGLSLGYQSFSLQGLYNLPFIQKLNSSDWLQKPAMELSLIYQLNK